MTHLELDGVTKVFGDPDDGGVVAVDDLSVEVPDGDLLVLLGPSGCGKTTTLRMVGGLEDPTEGEIRFDGTVVNDVKARNRDIAMVFQDFALYPHMSVRRNLGFGLRREDNDLTDAEIAAEIEDVATMLEIEELLDDRPAELSGGQKQRVALGRAIVREPRVFLFDEPLANLDASLRKTMRTEIDEIQERVGITSVYVTHNQEEAMTIADRIAVLDGGRLQQLGTPSEVFNEPTNLFVATFIGSPDMNLFDGTLERAGDGYRVTMDGIEVDIPAELVPGDTGVTEETDATGVTVGFRPQDLTHRHVDRIDGPTVPAEVRIIEPVGTDAIVHADSELGDLTARVDHFHELEERGGIDLTIAPEHVYLFEAETERLVKGRLTTERAAETEEAADEAEV